MVVHRSVRGRPARRRRPRRPAGARSSRRTPRAAARRTLPGAAGGGRRGLAARRPRRPRCRPRRDEDLRQEAARRREAERVAGTDPLTGLLNRRGWDLALAGARGLGPRASRRRGRPRPRRPQDRQRRRGHDAGDALLRRAGRLVAGAVEACDAVARTGGDEFCVLLLGRTRPPRPRSCTGWATCSRPPGFRPPWARPPPTGRTSRVRGPGRTRRCTRTSASARSGATPSRPPPPAGDDAWSGVEVDDLLRLLTDQLGTDAAFRQPVRRRGPLLPQHRGGLRHPRGTGRHDGPRGHLLPAHRRRCGPGVIPDALEVPVLADLPLTRALSIRRYLGAPVRTRDGRLYGTVCTFSRRPRLRAGRRRGRAGAAGAGRRGRPSGRGGGRAHGPPVTPQRNSGRRSSR